MSLAEIEKAIDELPPKELTKLAAYVIHRDKVARNQEIEEDFSPGGKHEKALAKIDAEIDSGNFTPLPRLRAWREKLTIESKEGKVFSKGQHECA